MNNLERVEKQLRKVRSLLDQRREMLARFDALPADQQRELTEQGLNPHEPAAIRRAKQKQLKEEINQRIDKLPVEARDKLQALGIYDGPERSVQPDRIIRRSSGSFHVEG